MRVEQLLSESAERFGPKAAIVAGRQHHSFADLHKKSDRLAAALATSGIKRSDRVAVFMDNTFEAIVAAFAVLKSGAVLAPIDPTVDAEVLARFLNDSRAVGIATESRLAATAALALAQARNVKIVVLAGGDRTPSVGSCLSFEDAVGRVGPLVMSPAAGAASDAAVVFLADSSGEPVTLTHDDLVAAALTTETREDAVVIAAVPISLHYGLYQLLTAIRAGATQVLQSNSAFRTSVFNRVDRYQADLKLSLAG